MSSVTVHTEQGYRTAINIRQHTVFADELINDGGTDTLDQALTATQRGIARRQHATLPSDVARSLHESMCRVRAEHQRLWLTRSRIGGLSNSCSHEDRVIEELERFR